jgi:hypothetical protein
MLKQSLKVRSAVGIGAAVAALAIAAPLAAADPAPAFMPQSQKEPRLGATLSPTIRDKLGEIGAWAVPTLRSQTPHLGEGLTGADRSWLAPASRERHVATPSNGFDWADAGIGAGTGVAFLLVIGGGAVAIRRRPSPAH